jgi:predicted site-specific integrase-resolvase
MTEAISTQTPQQTFSQKPTSVIDKADLRRQIDTLVMQSGLAMVEKTIKEVNEGHYQALKYLFEMIGLYPAPVVAEKADDSVALRLLTRFGLEPPKETNAQQD